MNMINLVIVSQEPREKSVEGRDSGVRRAAHVKFQKLKFFEFDAGMETLGENVFAVDSRVLIHMPKDGSKRRYGPS
jgi:hypothetical protein